MVAVRSVHHIRAIGRLSSGLDRDGNIGVRVIVGFDIRMEVRDMRVLGAIVLCGLLVSPAAAQVNMQYDGQSNGQYSGQYSGQVDLRVDGRANRNEGLPPSAADKGNGRFQNPITVDDCVEAQQLNPDARPGWQRRVNRACSEP